MDMFIFEPRRPAPFRTLLANATGRRICRGNMAGASPATTMIRLGKPMHSCHGSGAPCGDPVWETGNHARLHSIFHSPAESAGGKRGREKAWRGPPRHAFSLPFGVGWETHVTTFEKPCY